MAYTVSKTNSSSTPNSYTVQDGVVNTQTDLSLIGKGYAGYGELIGENFLKLLENFSNSFCNIINKKIDEIDIKSISDANFLTSGIPWSPIDYKTYKKIQIESDYASWVLALGYIANHFTVSVTDCSYFNDLAQLNSYLKDNGFEINSSGGEIKGSKDQGLEQSSIMSKEIKVKFSDGIHSVPGCYYEFAYRYNNFNGFITKSANHIFESTNEKSKD